MNLTINILDKDSNKDFIFIFINDYSKNKTKYKSYHQANELLSQTFSDLSILCNQNINCIVGDSQDDALLIAKNYSFKTALILYPGTSFNLTTLNKILQSDTSDMILKNNQKVTLGLKVKLSCYKSIDSIQTEFIFDHSVLMNSFEMFNTSDKWQQNQNIDTTKNYSLDKISHFYQDYLSNLNNREATSLHDVRLLNSMQGRKCYLFNNEAIYEPEIKPFLNKKIDCIAAPSGGFFITKLIEILNLNPSKIIYYDSFSIGLILKKYINDKVTNIDDLKKIHKLPFVSNNQETKQTELLKNSSLINIKTFEKSYHHIDIIKDPDLFIESIKAFENPWIWLSNIYTFNINNFIYGPSYIRQSFEYLIFMLKKNNPDGIIQGKNPSGRYFISRIKNYSYDYMGFTPNWKRV